jgi:hypothetical protein
VHSMHLLAVSNFNSPYQADIDCLGEMEWLIVLDDHGQRYNVTYREEIV